MCISANNIGLILSRQGEEGTDHTFFKRYNRFSHSYTANTKKNLFQLYSAKLVLMPRPGADSTLCEATLLILIYDQSISEFISAHNGTKIRFLVPAQPLK